MKKLTSLVIIVLTYTGVKAQGCIAIKNLNGGIGLTDVAPKTWQFSTNYRYFKSFRHFSGTKENPDRVANQTEVINHDNSLIFGANYTIDNRWSIAASVPLVYIDRSSLYEHDRINRHHTHSQGLGDIRLMGYYSIHFKKSNLFLGAGLKLPSGNYGYKDYFYTVNGVELRPVDQSIQPGDGGLGVITEVNFVNRTTEKLRIYFNGLYMSNARNTNGTRTFRETLSPLLTNEAIMSVPDQYLMRMGAQYTINGKLNLSLGIRGEGIPVRDAIGKSDGFRRPGFILSAEPGVTYSHNVHTFNLNIPFALLRDRQQSVTDRETEIATGNPRHGDAAFADYLLSFTYAYRLSKKFF